MSIIALILGWGAETTFSSSVMALFMSKIPGWCLLRESILEKSNRQLPDRSIIWQRRNRNAQVNVLANLIAERFERNLLHLPAESLLELEQQIDH